MIPPVEIHITEQQYDIAKVCAERLHIGMDGSRKVHDQKRADQVDRHNTHGGMVCEMAVAEYYNLCMTSMRGRGAPDVGGFIEVKSSTDHDTDPCISMKAFNKSKGDEKTIWVFCKFDEERLVVKLRGWLFANELSEEENCYPHPEDQEWFEDERPMRIHAARLRAMKDSWGAVIKRRTVNV